MTESEFDAYLDTGDGQSQYYEWLKAKCPELNAMALNASFLGGMYLEDFMAEIGVIFDGKDKS